MTDSERLLEQDNNRLKVENINLRAQFASAESLLREAVDLMEALLGLERGSGEKALAFINDYDAEVARKFPR